MIDDIVITDPNRNFGKPMFAVVGAPIGPVLERLLAPLHDPWLNPPDDEPCDLCDNCDDCIDHCGCDHDEETT
jgi:hypothetical protein